VLGPAVVETWGSSAAERGAAYSCDALIERPDLVLFRAVDVAAPPQLVFHWLCQLRVAPYSYDLIDNRGRRSPRSLTPGLDALAVGQRFMIFRLVSFEQGSSITLDSTSRLFGRVALTYRISPGSGGASRLIAKVMVAVPPGPLGLVNRHLLPAGDLIMMRKQLRTLKALAERDASETPTVERPS
jgi:hypothetical protein